MKSSTPTGLLDSLRERRRVPRQRKPGATPGALIFEGAQKVDDVSIEQLNYGAGHFERRGIEIEHLQLPRNDQRAPESASQTWLHVTGLHDSEKISKIGEVFRIPDLLLEDVLNTNAQGKIELLDDAIFIQIKVLERDGTSGTLKFQQLSVFIGEGILLSFCEGPTQVFHPIFRRLQNAKGRLRNRGVDYLLWALLDTVVDHAIASLHLIEQNLIEIDELIQEDHTAVSAADLYAQKHELMLLQHQIRPNREIIHSIRQSGSELISDDLAPFLDDLRDHAVLLSHECDALRDFAVGVRDYLLAELNQRMNNVMKVLTCISTIFLPLTFLAGVYGMNFQHMPELKSRWAYPFLWLVFLSVGGFLLLLFRRKKWL